MSQTWINVGCGEFRADGWINIDMTSEDGGPQPDIQASADDLPFEDKSVHRIYAGHVLEHISLDAVPEVLKEFKRVLADDGILAIVGPDLTRAEESFPDEIDNIKYGADRWAGDVHLWDSRESTMLSILLENGWAVEAVPIESDALNDWPVASRIGWQFAVMATQTE